MIHVSPFVWPRAEVEQIDAILAAAERHLVLVGFLRQELRVVALEGVHLLHVRLRVLVRDDLDRGREHVVAAGVVAVRVRVDDRRHRLVGDGFDPVEQYLAPAGELRIDHDDASGGDEDTGVAAGEQAPVGRIRSGDHVEVVLHLLDLRRRQRRRRRPARRRWLLIGGDRHRQRAGRDQD